MRNLLLFGCVIALTVSSGCQSGSTAFRNPFKDQFARTFPKSFPNLMTKSKESRSGNRGIYDLGEDGGDQSIEISGTATPSFSDPSAATEATQDSQRSEVEDIRQRADSTLAAGNLQEAAGLYKGLLALDPQNVDAHHRLAIIHDKLNDYETAEKYYMAALSIDPENLSILNDLGYSCYLQRRFDESKRYLEYILEVDKANQLAMRNLALVHASEGDLQQSFALLQQGGLSDEQCRQEIRQAVARANEGRATTGGGQSLASQTFRPEPSRSVVEGASIATTGDRRTESSPGRAGVQPAHGGAFQSRPDWDSAYGLSVNKLPGRDEVSGHIADPASGSPAGLHSSGTSPAISQGGSGIEQVSYNPSHDQPDSSSGDGDIVLTALNTGYGNLFPAISPKAYSAAQDLIRTGGIDDGSDTRNAYFEQFGQAESKTPNVVHAVDSRQAQDAAVGTRDVNSVVRRASYSRIQSPSGEAGQSATMTPAIPANAIPVTQPNRQSPQPPDYSQFPQQERPPFAESPAKVYGTGFSGSVSNGTTNMPQPGASGDQYTAERYLYNLPVDQPTSESASSMYNSGPRVSPMPEQSLKAHELALERYRQNLQQ